MTQNANGVYTGSLFGHDRIGHTTPDAEGTELLRPWLPIPYPAPYLPTLRQDQGHPVLAPVVLTSQMTVGQDKSGAIVPAGLFCGTGASNAGHATGGGYCALKYSASDVGFAYNAITGVLVAAAGEVAILASPSDGVAGDVITFSDGVAHTVTSGESTAAKACNLFPMNVVKPIGVTLRNVFQYIGGTTVTSTTGGMLYTMDGNVPLKYKIHNYMHEMGTAIQTGMVVRVPWIGALRTTLGTLASGDSIAGYTQGEYSRSFVHFTGATGTGTGKLAYGNLVVPSRQLGDAGHFAPFDSAVHDVTDICGRIIGIQNTYPIRDFVNRVRTLWDPSRLTGPIKDPNPSSIMMGGSATAGIDYAINLGTDGIFKAAYDQGKTLRPEYSTYVLIKVGP
jgi:hypothetical protein